jgi:hypothetical protein
VATQTASTFPRTHSATAIVSIVIAASVAMLGWMVRPAFTGEIPFTGDLLHFHYPLRDFYARALALGQRVEWMPSLFGGFYVAGEGQLGAYHPLHWLLYRWLPLDRAFIIELAAAYPLLFAGTWLFLRRWCPPAPATVGAMLFAFCGFNLSHGAHPNMVGVVAHVPWLLWAIHSTYETTDWRGRVRWTAAIGLLTGSQLLLGHPQAVWFSLVIAAAYTAWMLSMTPHGARARGAAAVAAGLTLGLAIGAVQVLATLHALEDSTRPANSAAYATEFSMPPEHLLQLVNPYGLWGRIARWNESPGAGDEFAVYGGAVPLVLTAWWLALYGKVRTARQTTAADRFALAACFFGVVGVWLATGSYGKLYYLQTWLPVVGQFRAPVRYVLFTQLSLVVVATIALTRLMQRTAQDATQERGSLWAPWGVVLASAASALWLTRRAVGIPAGPPEGGPHITLASTLAVWLGPLLFAGAASLLTLAVRRVRWALPGLVLLAGGDLALYGLGGVVAWQDFLTRPQAIAFLQSDSPLPPQDQGRLALPYPFPNLFALAGYRLMSGYVAIAPVKRLSYRSPHALRVAGVTFVHADVQQSLQLPGVQPLNDTWFRLVDSLPRARLVPRSRVSAQPDDDLGTLDVDTTALVTRELTLSNTDAGTAMIVRDDPGDIVIRTSATGRQLLIVSESFDTGWVAAIDGQPTPVERVNGDFIGSVAPAGEHEVSLQFRPSHLMWGTATSLGGVAAAALLAAGSFLVRARKAAPSAPEPPTP